MGRGAVAPLSIEDAQWTWGIASAQGLHCEPQLALRLPLPESFGAERLTLAGSCQIVSDVAGAWTSVRPPDRVPTDARLPATHGDPDQFDHASSMDPILVHVLRLRGHQSSSTPAELVKVLSEAYFIQVRQLEAGAVGRM